MSESAFERQPMVREIEGPNKRVSASEGTHNLVMACAAVEQANGGKLDPDIEAALAIHKETARRAIAQKGFLQEWAMK